MTDSERFWSKVNKTDTCWLWTRCLNKGGYGRFRINGETVLAHRYAYELQSGTPATTGLDHNCHQTRCVRMDPKHVRPTTQKQNKENRRGPQPNGTSGYRGVSWSKTRSKWEAHVTHNGRKYNLGRFIKIEDANAAAIAGTNKLFTHNDLDRMADVES